MSLRDLVTRVDAICKKYDKYDVEKHKEAENVLGVDPFARLYGVIEAELDSLLQKSEAAAFEKNRASAVAMNAEIRRSKARLLEELPKLQRLAFKKVKGLSKEGIEARNDLVSTIKERIEGIPDHGTLNGAKPTEGWTASTSYTGIKIDYSTSDGKFGSEYFQQTEETDRFRQEYEMRRMKQHTRYLSRAKHWESSDLLGSLVNEGTKLKHKKEDEDLDVIKEGLHTLKDMAHGMNEELDRQAPLMDEIDDKVDRANANLKNTNVRLKETIVKIRSSRNFCIDVILLSIVLGIAAYLYNVLK